jgi:peptide/nickel transport system ATP-binding protein
MAEAALPLAESGLGSGTGAGAGGGAGSEAESGSPPLVEAVEPERILDVRDLSVAYATDSGAVLAVDGIDLYLNRGEFLAVVGESGCGKSTLLFAITRLLSPPAGIIGGSILFRGSEMATMTEKQLRHIRWKEYSVVMQSAMNALNPVMTIEDQMRDACRAHSDMSNKEIEARSAEVLRLVSIDPAHLKSYPHQLSGGMRQRSMIAMALLFTPQLVVMDEPTSALDVVAQRSLMHQIKDLQRRLGFAVIFVTHDMSLVRQFSDRLMVMYAGQLAELGATARIFAEPSHPYTRGLLEAFPTVRGDKVPLTGIGGSPPDLARPPSGCRFAPRCAYAMASCYESVPHLYKWNDVVVRCFRYRDPGVTPLLLPAPAPKSVAIDPDPVASVAPPEHAPRAPQAAIAAAAAAAAAERSGSPPLLEVKHLTRHFRLGGVGSRRKLHAVDDVSFSIGEREIVALVGESGSGKSTLARLVAMTYEPESGEIIFDGRSLAAIKGRKAKLAYRGVTPMVFQDPYSSINPVLRVGHGISRAIRLHRPDLKRSERHAEACRVLDAVGLVPPEVILTKYPYELSGGQRQRIGFAQALVLKPRLIIADEPVSMLDVSIRIGILNLMSKLRDDVGVSILYITHDVASARYVADRVLVLYAGHLVEEGPTEQVLTSPRHPYTKLLLHAVPDPHVLLAEAASTDAGEPPRVIDPRPGCRFVPRCPYAIERCSEVTPVMAPVAPNQLAACHVAQMEAATSASPS